MNLLVKKKRKEISRKKCSLACQMQIKYSVDPSDVENFHVRRKEWNDVLNPEVQTLLSRMLVCVLVFQLDR